MNRTARSSASRSLFVALVCATSGGYLQSPPTAWAEETGADSAPGVQLGGYSAVATRGSGDAKPTAGSGPEPRSAPASSGSQTSPSSRPATAAGEEITVVGPESEDKKRRRRPGTLTTLSREELRSRGIQNVDDIDDATSNLTVNEAAGSPNTASITLRGIGGENPLTTRNSAIGSFVDGISLGAGQGTLFGLSDVERIDVLGGPQGTLGGAATLGGAVDIITRRPTFDFGGDASLRLGNFDLFETNFSLNVPLIPERLATRVSFASSDRDGFAENQFGSGNSTVGGRRRVSLRGDFLWNATDTLEVLFSASSSYAPNSPTARKCKFVNFGASPTTPTVPNEDSALRRSAVVSSSPERAPTTPEERDGLLETLRLAGLSGGNFGSACKEDGARDEFEVSADAPLRDKLVSQTGRLVATYSPSSRWRLRSTSAFVRSANDRSSDGDATGLAISGGFRPGGRDDSTTTSLSENLALSGSALGNKLRFTFGVFGMVQNTDQNTRTRNLSGTARNPAFVRAQGTNAEINARTGLFTAASAKRPVAAPPPAPGVPPMMGMVPTMGMIPTMGMPPMMGMTPPLPPPLFAATPPAPPPPVKGSALTTGFGECLRLPGDDPADLAITCLRPFETPTSAGLLKADFQSYALFGDASYNLTEKLMLSVGARLSFERRRLRRLDQLADIQEFSQLDAQERNPFGLDGIAENGGRFVSSALLAVNGITANTDAQKRISEWTPRASLQYSFTPTLTAFATYSRGFRGATTDSDDKTEILTQYELGVRGSWWNRRVNVRASAFTIVDKNIERANDGKGISQGGDASITLLPMRGLTLTSNLGITKTRFIEFETMPGQEFLKDNPFINTPTYTTNFSALYSLPISTLGTLNTRFSWRTESRRSSDTANNDFAAVATHGVLSGRIAFELSDGDTSIALFGSNLLDRRYLTLGVDLSSLNGTAQQFFAAPRTYGIEIRREF